MRVLIFIFFGMLFFGHSASAASLLGTQCAQAGATRLDTDSANIIACLCINSDCDASNAANLRWKAMTTDEIACSSGKAINSISKGQAVCAMASITDITCPSGQVVTSISGGVPTCGTQATVQAAKCPAQIVGGTKCSTYVSSQSSCSGCTISPPPAATYDRWGYEYPGYAYANAAQASNGTVVTWVIKCYIGQSGNAMSPMKDTSTSGRVVCADGVWK